MNNIAVIGTGYVGLVTGTCLSEFGFDVTCIDNDEKKIEKLKQGEIPIFEQGLASMVKENYQNGRLHFVSEYKEAIQNAEVIFIAVGTPPKEDGSADLNYVLDVVQCIAKYMNEYKIIVNKSTVPVGTAKRVRQLLKEELRKAGKNCDFDIVSNPEFLREGSAVFDFMHPDRIVIGTTSTQAEEAMKQVYEPLYLNNHPFVFCNNETAEMIKYASNAFLAVKIAYVNELSQLAECVGADIKQISKAMGLDGRISGKFLHAGPGYGGSCFPKDTKALCAIAEENGLKMKIVSSAIEANQSQKQNMVCKIMHGMGSVRNKKIAVLGLAFKPNTDDMREAPAITIIRGLLNDGAIIKAFDPEAMENAKRHVFVQEQIEYATNEYTAVQQADAVVILTEWNQFRKLNLKQIYEAMNEHYFFDLRNIYRRKDVEAAGFQYFGVGR
ncbi:UDP-glucose 6-dehydrogenase [Christensenellaceae bacterium]|nr:UDP-glucose 6-dehydrogenase [Christensenellaceae bacterium]BDF62120.1 UDP-glucose 6-dehydrogenase [Christensenellaceae bacterium]